MENKETKNSIKRPPVVVIMGHVDHGKSSILEAVKDLKITGKESGGITQHIGAYEIEHDGKIITFIDTPGHEAFSAMRSRGARVADIAILVIAAEESIKPQTKEAIEHIKKAGIPMIVALNKIDKPAADPEKVKRELLGHDVVVESMGGTIPSVNISAKTKEGITELLEMILLIADMEELPGNSDMPARGVVVESYMDSFRGPVATVILKEGKIKLGDNIGTSTAYGKVKGMENFQKKSKDIATASMPVIVLGFESVPIVGEEVKAYTSLNEYKKDIGEMAEKNLENLFPEPKIIEGQKPVNIILKADVYGSLEAIKEVLQDIPQDKAALRIAKWEVGDINDADVKVASTSGAKIIGFRVKANPAAKKLAEKEKITIIVFNIIYEMAQAVRNLLEKSLQPETIRIEHGQLKILAIFKTDKSRQIIGGKVIDGIAKRGAYVDVIRDGEKVGRGKIITLQQDKKETNEVSKRTECGMLYEGTRTESGDILAFYTEEKRKSEL